MARTNSRGNELSFRRAGKGLSHGRWFKTIAGKDHYFGPGKGITDRASYKAALEKYEQHQLQNRQAAERHEAFRNVGQMLAAAPLGQGLLVPVEQFQQHAAALAPLQGEPVHEAFTQWADEAEKDELLDRLRRMTVQQLRTMRPVATAPGVKAVGVLLDEFIAEQKGRLDKRQKLDKLRAAGERVEEAGKANISPARLGSILRDEKSFRDCCGVELWDGTEATADRIMRKYRTASEKLMLDGKHKANTFNERVKFGRMFLGWCETRHKLDRLPRDKQLFSKYAYETEAKAITLDTLYKLWDDGTDTERAWILLGLNCGYYAVDISDLTGEQVEGGYIHHNRGKTGVKVHYKLWTTTAKYLNKFLPATGSIFKNDNGTPLVHYGKCKKDSSKPSRVDNVRNHFYRLCTGCGVPTGNNGYSFGNVRDTSATKVEAIDRAYTDIFLAHEDKRMAGMYVDGDMVDSTGLDAVIDKLETQFVSVWDKTKRAKKEKKLKKAG